MAKIFKAAAQGSGNLRISTGLSRSNAKLVVIIFICGWSSLGQAKDLTKRLGVGVRENLAVDLPLLSASYYFGRELGVTAGFGIDTKDDDSRMAMAIGLRRNIFHEPNMHFYMGGQLATLNEEMPSATVVGETESHSGIEADLIFGSEFFFSGLESLGFSFEGGVGVVTLGKSRFRTLGDHLLRAGVHFYF